MMVYNIFISSSTLTMHETLYIANQQVDRQRQNYKNGKIPQDRFRRLNEIGFAWNARQSFKLQSPENHIQLALNENDNKGCSKYDSQWDERFKELVDFKRKHGHCSVPRDYNGSRTLQMWVSVSVFCFTFSV